MTYIHCNIIGYQQYDIFHKSHFFTLYTASLLASQNANQNEFLVPLKKNIIPVMDKENNNIAPLGEFAPRRPCFTVLVLWFGKTIQRYSKIKLSMSWFNFLGLQHTLWLPIFWFNFWLMWKNKKFIDLRKILTSCETLQWS